MAKKYLNPRENQEPLPDLKMYYVSSPGFFQGSLAVSTVELARFKHQSFKEWTLSTVDVITSLSRAPRFVTQRRVERAVCCCIKLIGVKTNIGHFDDETIRESLLTSLRCLRGRRELVSEHSLAE